MGTVRPPSPITRSRDSRVRAAPPSARRAAQPLEHRLGVDQQRDHDGPLPSSLRAKTRPTLRLGQRDPSLTEGTRERALHSLVHGRDERRTRRRRAPCPEACPAP